MLQSWVGSTNNRSRSLPYSFSERSDLWSGSVSDSNEATLSRSDFGGVAEGLIAGTLVATELGWQPVQDLRAGDRVVTFDNGMRKLTAVGISTLWTAQTSAPRSVWPVHIPKKALGNREVMSLLPNQTVLIESDQAEALFGDPFLMVSAGVLEGFNGITRVPPAREMTIVTLEFSRDEIVYANGTTLVHCPATQQQHVQGAQNIVTLGSHTAYQRLTDAQGRLLVASMQA